MDASFCCKSNEAGNSVQGGQKQYRHHYHEMAVKAVEKPATFSRDASNSSRNSQLVTANLHYFDIKPLHFRFFITQSLSNWFIWF
jgi:hypothetical protein